MKPRPRRAEREIAAILSSFFIPLGHSAVARIPVLGREGPDISINDFGLVVDVKSRIQCPRSYIEIDPRFVTPVEDATLAVKLKRLNLLSDIANILAPPIKPSSMVGKWLAHMDEWRRASPRRDGIAMIILHRPKLPFGESTAVIYLSQQGAFHDRYYHSLQCLHEPGSVPALAGAG